MGGAASKSKKGNFLLGVENLVTRLLMKQSWKDMQKLEQPEHCQKLIAITSKVLQKHLNSREIKYLANRVKTGEERPEKMQNVSWIPKHVLDELNKTKQQNCQELLNFISELHTYIPPLLKQLILNMFSMIEIMLNKKYHYYNMEKFLLMLKKN